VEKVTVFERNPEGVVAVKFKVPASAEQCIGIMNNRFFGGRQVRRPAPPGGAQPHAGATERIAALTPAADGFHGGAPADYM